MTLREFVIQQTRQRLDRLASEAVRAAESDGEDAVHDLRVAIRRFTQSLILFPDFFPRKAHKKITRRLKKMMNRTSEVRNRDVALDYLSSSEDPSVRQRLTRERDAFAEDVNRTLGRWQAKDFAVHWRAELRLDEERP